MKYHHIGIPTRTPREGETYLEKFRLYATDHRQNPYGIQWMRYESDSPLPELVKIIPHVAFEVENLEQALGKVRKSSLNPTARPRGSGLPLWLKTGRRWNLLSL